MHVTRWGEFGVHCCVYLALKNDVGPLGAQEISSEQKIPLQYAQQILHRLKKGGVVKSVRGPRGGYQLARSPEQISLREILAAAEGRTFSVLCDDNPAYADCKEARVDCSLRYVWSDLKRTIDEFLEAHSLAQLAAHAAQLSQQLVPMPKADRSLTDKA